MKKLNKFFLALMAVTAFATGVRADYDVSMRAYTNEPFKGLVFSSYNATPAPQQADYRFQLTSRLATGTRGVTRTFYVWAMPARGYRFNNWSVASATKVGSTTGQADQYTVTSSSSAVGVFETAATANAGWVKLTANQVTFNQSFGGNYTVTYSYREVKQNAQGAYLFTTTNEANTISANQTIATYATDQIQLDATGVSNFAGWYKNGALLSTDVVYNCTMDADATIECRTNSASIRAIGADNVTVASLPQDIQFYFEVEGVSNLTADAGIITQQGGLVTVTRNVTVAGNNSVTLSSTTPAAQATKTINVTVTPNAKNITKNISGDLAALVSAATAGDEIQLLNSIEVASSITIAKNLTLDLNGMIITGACDKVIHITAGAVTINGNGGTIRSEVAATDACAVWAAGAGLTINGGTYEAVANQETATGAQNANAYAINVAAGTATIENATLLAQSTNKTYGQNVYGVHITTTGAVALNNNTITAIARANAYGVNAGASTNVTTEGNTIAATATIGSGAFGVVTSGALIMNDNDNDNDDKVTVTAVSNNAYAIYANANSSGAVKGGKFIVNAGSASGFGPINDLSKVNSTLRIEAGYFSNNTYLLDAMADKRYIYDVNSDATEYAEGLRYEVSELKSDVYVCTAYDGAGNKVMSFKTLKEAFDMALNNPTMTLNIIMDAPYVLPAGDYSLPANAALVIPHKAGQKAPYGASPSRITERNTLAVYRELTFAAGVNIVIKGTLEISAQQFIQSAQTQGIGNVAGNYGMLTVNDGCNVWLDNGAKLCAWGYMRGNGNVNAKRGSKVYEMFQVYDWKGGTNLTEQFLDNHHSVFPINQYFIQNIEMPVTYRPGSQLLTSFGIVAANSPYTVDNIGIIGPTGGEIPSMFEMDDTEDEAAGVFVRKSYDPGKDRQVYEINNSAYLNAMTMNIMGYQFTSSEYQLPITNNMDIHLLAGSMDITQEVVMLPGATMEVDKEATITIQEGKKVYLYDADQWDNFAFNQGSKFAATAYYSPSWANPYVSPRAGAVTTKAGLGDAKINVHGTLDLIGGLYTTTDKDQTAGGANIYSTNEDAGTIQFTSAAPAASQVWQWKNVEQGNPKKNFIAATAPAAWLQNASGVTKSAGTAEGKSLCYMEGMWSAFKTVDCFVKDEANNRWFIKPAAYIQIKATTAPTEYADHTYRDDATGERMFIMANGECQWWEVTKVAETNYYKGTNNVYYEWVDPAGGNPGYWQEVKLTVTFDPANGEDAIEYNVKYNAVPQYMGDDPEKAATSTESYTFKGWSSDGGQTIYKFDPMPAVTEDITYTAQYETVVHKYIITFLEAKNGETVNEEFAYNTMPSYAASKAGDQYFEYYEHTGWNPALQKVTGAATYTALFTGVGPKGYTVGWYQEDASTLISEHQYLGGTSLTDKVPAYTRPEDTYYTYETQWISSVDGKTYAKEDLPLVGANVNYVAVFKAVPKNFTITFKNGATTLQEQSLPYGSVITYSGETPTKTDWDFDGWDPAFVSGVTTVSGTTTYTAQFSQVPAEYKYVAAIIEPSGLVHNYKTIGDAIGEINDCGDNITLRLLRDVTFTGATTITLNHPTTIDLNGCTFTASNTSLTNIFTVQANVVLKDGSTNGNGLIKTTAYGKSSYAIFYCNAADITITMENGNVLSTSHRLVTFYTANQQFVMNGGTMEVLGKSSASEYQYSTYGFYFNKSATCTINGGTITVNGGSTAYGMYINNGTSAPYNTGTIVLNGGQLNVNATGNVYGIYGYNSSYFKWLGKYDFTMKSGAISIKTTTTSASYSAYLLYAYDGGTGCQYDIQGGTISITGASAKAGLEFSSAAQTKALISGGKILIPSGAQKTLLQTTTATYQPTISGGYFGDGIKGRYVNTTATELQDYLADGYAIEDITDQTSPEYIAGYRKHVYATDNKAEIVGGEKYTTLQEAIDAATDNQTIRLLADISTPVTIAKSITLDLNDHTFSGSSALVTMNAAEKTLQIVDNGGSGNGKMHVDAMSANTNVIYASAGTVEVEGGNFSIIGEAVNKNIFKLNPEGGAEILAQGGYYNMSVADFVADGYQQVQTQGIAVYSYMIEKLEAAPVVTVSTATGTQGFTTWETAMNFANQNANSVVTLLSDITPSATAHFSRGVTIDLNGFNITSTQPILTFNAFGKTLTIRDNQNRGAISVNNASAVYAISIGLGNLVIENGRFISAGNAKSLLVNGGGTAAIQGGYFTDFVAAYVAAPKGLRELTPEEKTEFAGLNYVVDTESLIPIVSFVDYNGAVLSCVKNEGQTPACTCPTRPADEQYAYTFQGWLCDQDGQLYACDATLPVFADVNVLFTAQYTATPTIAYVEVNSKKAYVSDWADVVSLVNAATNAVVVKLLTTIETDITAAITVNKAVTIDLNGFNLTSTSTCFRFVTNYSACNIINSGSQRSVIRTTSAGDAVAIYNEIKSLTIDANVSIEAVSTSGTAVAVKNSYALTISSGYFRATSTSGAAYAVWSEDPEDDTSEATISGGKFYISGNASSSCIRITGTYDYLSGGYFNTDLNLKESAAIYAYNVAPVDPSSPQYDAEYPYTLEPIAYAAQVNQAGNITNYATLAAALSNNKVTAGSTTKLLRNVYAIEGTEEYYPYMTVNANTTLDLAGYTIASKGNTEILYSGQNIQLTIVDSSANQSGVMLSGEYNPMIRIQRSSTFTFKSGTFKQMYKYQSTSTSIINLYATSSWSGANTVIIEGGKFWVENANNYVVYIEQYADPGTVIIKGGYFNSDKGYMKDNKTKANSTPFSLSSKVADGYSWVDVDPSEPEYAEGYRYKVIVTPPSVMVKVNNDTSYLYDWSEVKPLLDTISIDNSSITIKLLRNIATTSSTDLTVEGKTNLSYTFDLNGHALNVTAANAIKVPRYYNFDLINSVEKLGKITCNNTSTATAISIPEEKTITTDGVKTISGNVRIEATTTKTKKLAYALNSHYGITINGGEFIATSKDTAAYAVYFRGRAGNLVINEGKFKANMGAVPTYPIYSYKWDAAFTLNRGYLNKDTVSYKGSPKYISGRLGASSVIDTLAETDPLYIDGYRYRVAIPPVAMVKVDNDTTYFTSWSDVKPFLDNVAESSSITIKLLQDIATTSSTDLTVEGKTNLSYTFDLNGHALNVVGVPNAIKIPRYYQFDLINSVEELGEITCSSSSATDTTILIPESSIGSVAPKTISGNVRIQATATGSGNKAYALYTYYGVTINGGEFIANSESAAAYAVFFMGKSGNLVINDGKFKTSSTNTSSSIYTEKWDATLMVNGGYFDKNKFRYKGSSTTDKSISERVGAGLGVAALVSIDSCYADGYRYKVTAPVVMVKVNDVTKNLFAWKKVQDVLDTISLDNSSITIKLLKDVNADASTNFAVTDKMNLSYTMDLNGHALNVVATKAISVPRYYKFDLMNSSENLGEIVCSNSTNKATAISIPSTSTGTNAAKTIGGNVRITATVTSTNSDHNALVIDTYYGITINGGEFIASAAAGSAYAVKFWGKNNSSLVINDGKFKASRVGVSPYPIYTYKWDNKFIINGGYFNMDSLRYNNGSGSVINPISERLGAGYGLVALPTTDPLYAEGYRYYVRAEVAEWTVEDEQSLEKEKVVMGDLTVATAGKLTVQTNGTLTTNNLIIKATAAESGQLISDGTFNLLGNAYFDVTLDADAMKWYDIAMPFEVNAETGIYAGGNQLVLGKDFDVIYYDGAQRALNGKNTANWIYLEDIADKVMHPGVGYMILFAKAQSEIRFVKESEAEVFNTTATVALHPAAADNNANWNAIANPTLYHATLGLTGVTYGQVYNPADDSYDAVTMASNAMVSGRSVYVQSTKAESAIITPATAGAPVRRMGAEENFRVDVSVLPQGATTYTDHIYAVVSEDAEGQYTIGQDVAKAGVSAKVAQLWIAQYASQLCVNTMAPVEDVTTFPLGIFAPQAGNYIIRAEEVPQDVEVILMHKDVPVWNFSANDYIATLDKGDNTNYKLVVKSTRGIGTGVRHTESDSEAVQKIVLNNQLYIIRSGRTYRADGSLVK